MRRRSGVVQRRGRGIARSLGAVLLGLAGPVVPSRAGGSMLVRRAGPDDTPAAPWHAVGCPSAAGHGAGQHLQPTHPHGRAARPGSPLHSWASERRDVWADFRQLFGDESEAVPPMAGVAVAADADNTQRRSVACVASITLD